jgi:tetratricopeptide (TPR) repeat protein
MSTNQRSEVKVWEEIVTIPTYKIGQPDKNPMFLEKRVYQGSSGVVYPHPVIDKVYDEKEDQPYRALFLENDYLKIMILPELGGRVQMAYDKTNDYHFVYYNRVIKPALVGLAGPWISGGIEFNWPQHHRPSTFDPIDYTTEENPDGSKTVWVSEIEKMFHTKGMAGFTLYPDKAYLEITGKLYNRTPLPQTFLWWANPAVQVDEHYQSVFPPDVHAVYDHGKRDVSSFPIATGTYYKVDYSPGTDISRYKNIPVPTSYMAVNSAFDFVGGYHHGKKAGMLHVANHHVSPGKKQWTWGCGEFGQAWDRQLTDEDGPYFELMTGVFTDNQPDFSWIMPNEERQFKQYFMPYKNIGYVKNATPDAAVNLEMEGNQALVQVYVTAPQPAVTVRLLKGEAIVLEDTVDLSPVQTYQRSIILPVDLRPEQFRVSVSDEAGRELVAYTPVQKPDEAMPDPATPIGEPATIPTNEALYLAGQHLEQYRHATYSPLAYYEEALRRDPADSRNNQALGRWYLRRGQFTKAEPYFRKVVETLTRHNPNPSDGEPLYNLGLSLFYQEKWDEAYTAFAKAAWNAAWQDNAYLQMARIDLRKGKYTQALESATYSVIRNYHGLKARHLKTVALRKIGRLAEAEAFARETLAIDPFDFASGYELHLILATKDEKPVATEVLQTLQQRMREDSHTFTEIALDYAQAGLYPEAIKLLEQIAPTNTHPMPFYYLASFFEQTGQAEKAQEMTIKGFSCHPDRVFPNRIEDIAVLQRAVLLHPKDYKAWYYLGNLWYDKRQYEEAIAAWETSRQLFDQFPTVHRNLGLAYFNRRESPEKALESYEKAFALDPTDSRILFELDQLYRRLNRPAEERLDFLNRYSDLVSDRDDLFIEYVTLHNLTGNHVDAARLLASHTFHPWEGGEGKVSGQHVLTQVELAKKALSEAQYGQAVELLRAAEVYPSNLGEGKLYGAQENDVHYWLGCAYEGWGEEEKARHYWQKASTGISEPAAALFYNDQPPDKIFYQGQALLKIDHLSEAHQRFLNLIAYGEAHLYDTPKIDFFAVSLPDLLIFDDDLNKRNRVHCQYLLGLGYMGLRRVAEAQVHFDEVLRLDVSHLGALLHKRMLQQNNQAMG